MAIQSHIFCGQQKGEGGINIIITLASFLKVPKMWLLKRLKIDVFDNPTIVLRLLFREPIRTSA